MILLYKTLIDFFTATSYEPEFYEYWSKKLAELGAGKDGRLMQYDGLNWHTDIGNVFLGAGMQRDSTHNILRVSGGICDELYRPLLSQHRQGFVRVTRLDLQMTIPEPDGWSQWRLFNRMKQSGKTVGWIQSDGGNAGMLETVYIGARSSERMTRVYVKVTAGNERLLRFETEYKGNRANAIARALAGGELPDDYLRHEMEVIIKDPQLVAHYLDHLLGNTPANIKLTRESNSDKTKEWLLGTVLTSFRRYINDHDGNGEVIGEFWKAIQDHDRWAHYEASK